MEKSYCYEILIDGDLGEQWADWFDGMAIQPRPNSLTRLIGMLDDQAALLGVLNKLHALNLQVVSITRVSQKKE